MPPSALQTRIKELLTTADSPHARVLLELFVDALLAQPAALGLREDEVTNVLLSALTEGNAQRFMERYIAPGAVRAALRVAGSQERVADLLPDAARKQLPGLVASAEGPRLAWLSGALAPSDLRELLAPVLQQTLMQFATKLPIPGLSGSGPLSAQGLGNLVGLLGKQMQKGARELAEVGRNVVSGISSELERRLNTIAQEFSHTADAGLQKAVLDRLNSPEGKVIVGRMRERIVQHVLDAQLKDIGSDFAAAPLTALNELVPAIVAHLREQPLFRAALEAETKATLATLTGKSLRELLTEAGLHDQVRAQLLAVSAPVLAATFASPGFDRFLTDLLTEAGA